MRIRREPGLIDPVIIDATGFSAGDIFLIGAIDSAEQRGIEASKSRLHAVGEDVSIRLSNAYEFPAQPPIVLVAPANGHGVNGLGHLDERRSFGFDRSEHRTDQTPGHAAEPQHPDVDDDGA
jgi:hypothetical protein